MIEVQKLQKMFGARTVVKNVSFVAPNGAITGILGANGAGKTTVLRMISGVLRPSGGDVFIDGSSVGKALPAAQERLGSLLDHTGVYSRLTARENLVLFGKLRQIPDDVLRVRVDETLRVLGLRDLADTRTAGFSQGERMKVALGRVLVHRPSNLILDEPTNALDILSIRALRSFLQSMREEGRCILFSSHVLDEIESLCDRVVILSSGDIVADGSIAEICEQTDCSSLEEAFVSATCPVGEVR